MDLANVEEKNVAVVVPQIKDENVNRIVVKGENFNIQSISRADIWINMK